MKDSLNYLEFGAGGSTFLGIIHSNCKVHSVESDKNWVKYLRYWKIIRKKEKNKQLEFHHINIGKTVEWGFPKDNNMYDNYPNYSKEIFTKIDTKSLDTVFIDGRFRVACALSTILNCNNDIKILIHDYPNREQYKILEKYLDLVELVDRLAIFKIKSDIDYSSVLSLYEDYKFIPD